MKRIFFSVTDDIFISLQSRQAAIHLFIQICANVLNDYGLVDHQISNHTLNFGRFHKAPQKKVARH